MPPKTGATHNRSRIFSSPSYNEDMEAASQQLLAENDSITRQSAAAAVRGANFLNAARALPAPKSGKLEKPGKLKKVSLPGLGRSKARGAGVYDLDPSPQKRRLSLPAQSEAIEDDRLGEMGTVVPETSQVQPEEDRLKEVAAALPNDEDADEEVSSLTRAENAPANIKKPRGRPPKRKSAESAASARISNASSAASREEVESSIVDDVAEQQDRGEPEQMLAVKKAQRTPTPAVKKRKILKGPKFQHPETADTEDDVIAPVISIHRNAQSRGGPQPEIRIPFRVTRMRTADAEAENATDHSATAIITDTLGIRKENTKRSPKNTRSPRTTRSSSTVLKPTKRKATRQERTLEGDNVEAVEASNKLSNAATRPVGEQHREGNFEQDEAEDIEGPVEKNEQREEQDNQNDDIDEESNLQDERPEVERRFHRPDPDLELQRVFEFADSDERSGTCSTILAREIHRTCDSARVTLSRRGELPNVEDIIKCKDDLIALLTSIQSRVKEERRFQFKLDAFGYLFRSLTLVLRAMHDKLEEQEGVVTRSLTAMQIIYPFIRDMLHFKDAMDAWKVNLPKGYKGDRIIKRVESDLIAPLRLVEKHSSKCLDILKREERSRQLQLAAQRGPEEQEIRQLEAASAAKERRQRWQDLHIIRMQCEPDALRRRKLRFVEPVEIVETDANGNQFERVPFLGERSMPPPRLAAVSSNREWTQEQETVLLDALQSSIVLEKIFKQHCRPGGALREFTVSDIVAKMAWVRSGWAQLSQQHGWEIPEWVKKIPVLP